MTTPAHCRLPLPVLCRAVILFFLTACCYEQASAQHPRDSLLYWYPQIKFNIRAPAMLPQLVQDQQWTALQHFLDNWSDAPYPNPELIFCVQSLLDINNDATASKLVRCEMLVYLADYAKEYSNIVDHNSRFRYYLKLDADRRYDATKDIEQLVLFIRHWAATLKKSKQLNPTAAFLCDVFLGNIADPLHYYQLNAQKYPGITQMQNMLAASNATLYRADRNNRQLVVNGMLGAWMPTGQLATILGVHPSVGFEVGSRTKWNEYVLVIDFRFINAAQDYTVIRRDTALTSNKYFGGYMGLEYTRYLLHPSRFDIGVAGGIGYDGFDVKESPKTSDQDNSDRTNKGIGSLNMNAGVRLKYFFNRGTCLGLMGKYNLINYCNTGGTTLQGNAFSIAITYGNH